MKTNTHNYAVNTRAGARCVHCEQHARQATNDCPGKPLDYVDSLAVKEGLLDYRNGKWVRESSAAYQREHGMNRGVELYGEEPKSLWGYLPSVSVILLVLVSIASIYELYTKAH